jgi:hypothetical protein
VISYVAVTAWIVTIGGIRCKQQKYQSKATRFNGQSSLVLTRSMKPHQLDMQRTTMMEALYAKSGRTCCTYSGLWQEFCADIGPNFRDADYAQLHADVCQAMDETNSIMTQKQAQQAIAICRRYLLGKWA